MAKLFMPIKSSENISVDTDLNLEKTFIERRFGRSSHYLLFDTETKKKELIPNTNHHFGGTSSPAGIAKENHADAILAAHMGYGPYVSFNNFKLPIYKADENTPISDLISMQLEGKLDNLPPIAKNTCCSGHH